MVHDAYPNLYEGLYINKIEENLGSTNYYSLTGTPDGAKSSQVNKQNHFQIYGNDVISNRQVQEILGTGRSNSSVSLELSNSTRRCLELHKVLLFQ